MPGGGRSWVKKAVSLYNRGWFCSLLSAVRSSRTRSRFPLPNCTKALSSVQMSVCHDQKKGDETITMISSTRTSAAEQVCCWHGPKNPSPPRRRAGCMPPSPFLTTLTQALHISALSVFGVLGRIGLKLLFGPDILGVTGPDSALATDLPANALASFAAGILTHAHVRARMTERTHEHLILGLGTGLLGSLSSERRFLEGGIC
mmetsp:Transcript_22436/g.55581  ORF Transcript_22436/g.55581 Transcript_22436/m.55581 type:complete len:203 (-) Transcript_22436:718-1326(-)